MIKISCSLFFLLFIVFSSLGIDVSYDEDPFSTNVLNRNNNKPSDEELKIFENQLFGFDFIGVQRTFKFLGLNEAKPTTEEVELIKLSDTYEDENHKIIAIDLIFESWGSSGRDHAYAIFPQSAYQKNLKHWNTLAIEDEIFNKLYQTVEPPYPEVNEVAVTPWSKTDDYTGFVRLLLVSNGKIKKYFFLEPKGISKYIKAYRKTPDKYLQRTDKAGKDYNINYPFDIRHFKNTASLLTTTEAISILTGTSLYPRLSSLCNSNSKESR